MLIKLHAMQLLCKLGKSPLPILAQFNSFRKLHNYINSLVLNGWWLLKLPFDYFPKSSLKNDHCTWNKNYSTTQLCNLGGVFSCTQARQCFRWYIVLPVTVLSTCEIHHVISISVSVNLYWGNRPWLSQWIVGLLTDILSQNPHSF